MSSDLSEKSLEATLVAGLVSSGWTQTDTKGFDAAYGLDLGQLIAFLDATQPKLVEALDLRGSSNTRLKALARIQGEITRRGIVDVLRKGIEHEQHHIDLFYGTPSPGNTQAAERYALNRFTVVRQLHFSPSATALSVDVCLLINGLPVVTFELKNSLTKQTYNDAIRQYQNDRDPKELLFGFKRAIAHFAVDDAEAWFTTKLEGKASWFLPFNQGVNDGAGNPVNPNGMKTAYLWQSILTRDGLTDIFENYAQTLTETDNKSGKKREAQVFPRFHQLDVVRKLLVDVRTHGCGRRYLVEHSAGSGKSNSIAWLTHQLVRLERPDEAGTLRPVFDTVIVATDRRVLDQQIQQTIKSFAQVGATVKHAESSADLREAIQVGVKVIVTTVQKFPFVLAEIGDEHRDRHFAIVIDEAHSSQGGKTSRALTQALSTSPVEGALGENLVAHADQQLALDDTLDEDGDVDEVQDLINQAMASRKMADNASYFAFTATPKNKTLEMFGTPVLGPDGETQFEPFHTYTMKQAVEEGFILDVLKSYTPVQSYYRLVKTVSGDPEFDSKRAQKKLRAYVEGNQHAVNVKAHIMVDHFLDQVIALRKIGGEARGMVVTGSIRRAMQYFTAISAYWEEIGSPYKAIVAFSGEHEFGGKKVTEALMNGFPSSEIPDRIKTDPYRLLVCADKFQTGYDEPLLHTMYVDKMLSGVKAVQTLSRLNRAHPKKHDVFVLDFQNDVDTIRDAFAPFYRTTILSSATDANKLHDLKTTLDDAEVYAQEQVEAFVAAYLKGADREQLDPVLDACVATYKANLDEDEQVTFKGSAKSFCRTYDFLASILPYSNPGWEKLSIFLNFLVSKLPAPVEPDASKGILETIDMDSYRAEKQAAVKVLLPDENGLIEPVPAGAGGRKPEPEMDKLSNILKTFNDLFGHIKWVDADRITKLIASDIPEKVKGDKQYVNARKNSDKANARIESDNALQRVIVALMKDDTELFKQFMDNPEFRRWLSETVFDMTYEDAA
ncbi:MAG: type I restriction endonuclease subunit R [Candidatus Nanopelagicales bacterium]